MKNLMKPIILAAAIPALASTSAFADRVDMEKMQALKVGLTDAIATAEAHVNGKALEAEFEDNSFSPEYEIDVYTTTHKYEVTVDASNGEVTKTKEKKLKY